MIVVDPDVTRIKLERELELWHENEETYRRRGWILLGRNELEVDIGFLVVEDLPLARDGAISGILVSHGWLRPRRTLLRLDEVRRIDHDLRVVELCHPKLEMSDGVERSR